jgi:predicted transcriptional regulator
MAITVTQIGISHFGETQRQQALKKAQYNIENFCIPYIEDLMTKEGEKGHLFAHVTPDMVIDNENIRDMCHDVLFQNMLKEHLAKRSLKLTSTRSKEDPTSFICHISWEKSEEEEYPEEEARFEEEPVKAEEREAAKAPVEAKAAFPVATAPPTVGQRLRRPPRPTPVSHARRTEVKGGGASSLSEVLTQIPVQQIAMDNFIRKRLVLVGVSQPLEKALSRINTHNILSLPVVDDLTKDVIGLLDVLDIIATMSEAFSQTITMQQRRSVMRREISEVLKKHTKPIYMVAEASSLMDAIKHFANINDQRMLIVQREVPEKVCELKQGESTVCSLLTQSDILRFIGQNIEWMKREPVFQKTLRELDLGSRKPITLNQSVAAREAFNKIHDEGREGIALVDNDGKLVANLSASNIKGIRRQSFHLLQLSCDEFLLRDRRRGWWSLPICVNLDNTLEHVVLQFVVTQVHRLYIVDNEGKPTGEVTPTDVLHQLKNLST